MFIRICDCCEKRITGKELTVASKPKPLHFCDENYEMVYFDGEHDIPELTDEEASFIGWIQEWPCTCRIATDRGASRQVITVRRPSTVSYGLASRRPR